MQRLDEGEDFFDSRDYLSSEESIAVKEDLSDGNLGYKIWLSEPQSAKERRKNFLDKMGFVELIQSNDLGKDRIEEHSGAVSSSCASPFDDAKENSSFDSRELDGEANCAVDELVNNPNVAQHDVKVHTNLDTDKKKPSSWWRKLVNKVDEFRITIVSEVPKRMAEKPKVNRVKVKQNRKRCKELSAVYLGQEIPAHEGFIWTMKFSPDGQYLASGGEEGVVRVWRVKQADASCKDVYDEITFSSGRQKSSPLSIVIPDKVFQIEEFPVQEFHGHTGDVLDLAWSDSNFLLSSSEDKTVRLWQMGCSECLNVFQHNNYVTCIQFNPTDDNYFISGSIDGKVRIWGLSQKRVVDWADVRDVISAVSYQPDGKGFIVGSITGICRFYGKSDGNFQLDAQIHFRGRRKTSSNKITGIKFTDQNSQRVMITSEDSKVRILDGVNIVHKYKGLAKSGSQMSASFTSTGRHIVSVGADSCVYVWNYNNDLSVNSSKTTNSIRSCERFHFDGVSIAIPWSSTDSKQNCWTSGSPRGCLQPRDRREASLWRRDSGRFLLANCFSMDGSATWPEEKLPVPNAAHPDHANQDLHRQRECHNSATWGLVFVTAGWDGMIRTFHNYGLPVAV